jgi:hypothetical protein
LAGTNSGELNALLLSSKFGKNLGGLVSDNYNNLVLADMRNNILGGLGKNGIFKRPSATTV